MNTLPMSVVQALADPLADARARATRGERFIGMVGHDVPAELVCAAGAQPLALPGFTDRPTPLADAVLEPSFSPLLRSVVEQWLTGQFDFMPAVVFSRSDDSAQRSYYYLCELQRIATAGGPRPLVFDAAKIPRPSSLAHTEAALRLLATELGTQPEHLAAAIETRNRRRHLVEQLAQLRRSDCPPLGSVCTQLLSAADLLPHAAFDRVLADSLQSEFEQHGGPRLLLTGTAPPDARLHIAVERAGGCVVAEVGDYPATTLGAPITPRSEPFRALAEHYHSLGTGPRSFANLPDQVCRAAREYRVDGVILWLIEAEEALAWQAPPIARALARERFPLLTLTGCRWDAGDSAAEQIAQFTRSLSPAR